MGAFQDAAIPVTFRTTRGVAGRLLGVMLTVVGFLAMGTTQVQANRSQIPGSPQIGSLVSVGPTHACYLVANTVKCWGSNFRGQLGVGTTIDATIGAETAVPGISNAVALSLGRNRSCALLADGTIRCWGEQGNGILGNGLTAVANVTSPVTLVGISNAVDVELNAGGGGGGCVLTATPQVWCWGRNSSGVVGDGTTTDRAAAVPVSTATGLTHPIGLSSGPLAEVACAVTEGSTAQAVDNELWCWGNNLHGQVTTGAGAAQTEPRRIMRDPTTPLTGVVSAAADSQSTCVLLHQGEVWCWGQAQFGRLGNGVTASALAAYPVQVMQNGATPLTDAISLSVSEGTYCAATLSGGTRGQRCWGGASFPTGYASFVPNVTASNVAHIMAAPSTAPPMSMGSFDWCAVMDDGSLMCGRGSNAPILVATGLSGGVSGAPTTPSAGAGDVVLPPDLAPLITAPVTAPTPSTTPPTTAPPATTAPPTTAPSTTTPAPAPAPGGSLPDLSGGEALVTVDGEPAEAEVVVEDESLVLRSAEFELRVSGTCTTGCTVEQDETGGATVTLVRSGRVDVSGFGFLPGSVVHVWVFSEPHYLGAIEVQVDGTYSGSFPLADLESGEHTLQANGISVDNLPRSASLGIVVAEESAPTPGSDTLPTTGNGDTLTAAWAMVLVALGAVLTLTTRRRRWARR